MTGASGGREPSDTGASGGREPSHARASEGRDTSDARASGGREPSHAAREAAPAPVLLFDGVCVLCNGVVRWVIARDRRRAFRFAALQSRAAQGLLGSEAPDPGGPARSVMLLQGGRRWTRSGAAVRVLRLLGGPWALLGTLVWLVPRPLRDAAYDLVAARRERWFGRLERCPRPVPEERSRFLDAEEW